MEICSGHTKSSGLGNRIYALRRSNDQSRLDRRSKILQIGEQEWPKDLPWMKENTEIRAANESQQVNNIQIKESRRWGEIKFNHQDFPSYTKLTGELPSKHPLSDEIIKGFHWKHSHMGTDMVLSQLRQHYWIIRGRESMKRVGRRCAICIRERVKPSHQQMAGVPKERLAVYKHPFSHRVVDYFGPMEVGLSRNRTDKRYGALFTCLTTRAVYLDLAPSLSS